MREKLLKSASKLAQPSSQARREFADKMEELVVIGNKSMSARSDFNKLVGAENHEMAENNNANFARFMDTMFLQYEANILVETVLWVFKAYRSHGFQTTYWAANIDTWLKMLKKEMSSETFAELSPFYTWLIVNIPVFVQLTDVESSDKIPCGTKDSESE